MVNILFLLRPQCNIKLVLEFILNILHRLVYLISPHLAINSQFNSKCLMHILSHNPTPRLNNNICHHKILYHSKFLNNSNNKEYHNIIQHLLNHILIHNTTISNHPIEKKSHIDNHSKIIQDRIKFRSYFLFSKIQLN